MSDFIAGHEIDIQDTGAPRGGRNYWRVLLNGQSLYEGHNGAQARLTYRAVSEGLKRATQPAAGEPKWSCLNSWFLSLEPGRQAVLREDKWMLAGAAFDAGRQYLAPPAAAPVAAGEPLATWVALTAAGQLRKGDKIRFRFGQETLTETVALVLDAGTEREEVVYNRKRNFYFITSKALAGTSSAKEVEVLRTMAAPPAAAHGDEAVRKDAEVAIKQGRYLASAAEGYMKAVSDAFDLEETNLHREVLGDSRTGLASAVCEFRKLADAAMRDQAGEGEDHA